MKKSSKRVGSTETFSVSVDAETKAALRELADLEFGGNLSALVKNFAEEARRRKAAGDYLRRHQLTPLARAEAEALQKAVMREARSVNPKARRRAA
jgi:hypothetical protein